MITINFFGGSYGHFLGHFLNFNITKDCVTELGHFHIDKTFKKQMKLTHEDILPSDKFNIKITYDIKEVDLISRMRWHKNYWETPERFDTFHSPTIAKYSYATREIVGKCFYKVSFLSQLDTWNQKNCDTALYIPFNFFLSDLEKWMDNWKTVFESLQIPVDGTYIRKAHQIFNESQKIIFKIAERNDTLPWHSKDIIAKANFIGQLLFEKHTKDNVPIPISKYQDTMHMICEWVSKLDKNNGNVSQLF